MAESPRQSAGPAGTALLGTAVLGAMAGASGLAWWLWRQSRRRQVAERENRLLRLSRFQGGVADQGRLPDSTPQGEALPERVQQLNQAIEEVRRQLEGLQSPP
jgi:hypothetical protein